MAQAGRYGDDIRSDCLIEVELGGSSLNVNVESSVKAMFGKQIEQQVRDECAQLGVENAQIIIKDRGALPFVISARLESALSRAGIKIASPVWPQKNMIQTEESNKDRLRRSRLYLPGNTPHLFLNAGLHEPDGIILDLEDSVAPAEKDTARALVRNALLSVDFFAAERMVRINPLPAGLEDLEWVVPFGVHLILIPKCESAEQVQLVDEKIQKLNPDHHVWLLPIIESARGCFAAFEIAGASPNVVALTIGLEDYTADLGASRTFEGQESLWARSMIINAAKSHGLQAISSVYSDVEDMDGCFESAVAAKALGFDGMGCIHPRQIPVVHRAFNPTPEEIAHAQAIAEAYESAKQQGLGVVVLGNKMIDAPVVKRALAILKQAERLRVRG